MKKRQKKIFVEEKNYGVEGREKQISPKTIKSNLDILNKFKWSHFVLSEAAARGILKACNFMKKKLHHRCFPMKFTKFLRTPIFQNICFNAVI